MLSPSSHAYASGRSRVYKVAYQASVQVSQTTDDESSIDEESTRFELPFPIGTIKELHAAAYVGDLASVTRLIKSVDYCMCEEADDSGNAALHHAVMHGWALKCCKIFDYFRSSESCKSWQRWYDSSSLRFNVWLYGHCYIPH